MRKIESLEAFIQAVEDRKRSLGITEEMIADARDGGDWRTPEKRETLARIQGRARRSGMEPLKAHF